MNAYFAPALVIAVLGACDPGGSYHVLGGTVVMDNGKLYEVAGTSQTLLRASATWFTASLDVHFGVVNHGSTPLAVRPNQLRMSDREGVLTRGEDAALRCSKQDGERVVLAPGETCDIHARFPVKANGDQLRTLILTQNGITRGEVAVPISLTFEMD